MPPDIPDRLPSQLVKLTRDMTQCTSICAGHLANGPEMPEESSGYLGEWISSGLFDGNISAIPYTATVFHSQVGGIHS